MTLPYPRSNIYDALSIEPNEAARIQICERFFGTTTSRQPALPTSIHKELFAGSFHGLYQGELDKLTRVYNKNWKLGQLAIKTHQDVLNVVDILETKRNESKTRVLEAMKAQYSYTNEKQIEDSIDLVVRIRFMINAGPSEGYAQDQAEPLYWKLDQTLLDFIRCSFLHATWAPEGKDSRLSPLFRAAYMVDVCGLELKETSCLREHLHLDRLEKKNVLKFFPYKLCLNALDTAKSDPIIPREVIRETIKSLNLLFPINDPATGKLLQRRQQTFHREEPFEDTLNVLEFDIWRDRLLILYQEVFLTPPASWAQLYRDRRNPQQFWTFWIALVILVLTIVSTVASVVQSVYSVMSFYK